MVVLSRAQEFALIHDTPHGISRIGNRRIDPRVPEVLAKANEATLDVLSQHSLQHRMGGQEN